MCCRRMSTGQQWGMPINILTCANHNASTHTLHLLPHINAQVHPAPVPPRRVAQAPGCSRPPQPHQPQLPPSTAQTRTCCQTWAPAAMVLQPCTADRALQGHWADTQSVQMLHWGLGCKWEGWACHQPQLQQHRLTSEPPLCHGPPRCLHPQLRMVRHQGYPGPCQLQGPAHKLQVQRPSWVSRSW